MAWEPNSGSISAGSTPRAMRAQTAMSGPATRSSRASPLRGSRTPTTPTSASAGEIRETASGIVGCGEMLVIEPALPHGPSSGSGDLRAGEQG